MSAEIEPVKDHDKSLMNPDNGESFALLQRPNLAAALDALERPEVTPVWAVDYYGEDSLESIELAVTGIERSLDDYGNNAVVITGTEFPFDSQIAIKIDYEVPGDNLFTHFDMITIYRPTDNSEA